jgi:hypothetical protein
MKPILNSRYLAGLWEYQLLPQLLWRSVGEAKRTTTYQAPTWSWASRPGEVEFVGSLYFFGTLNWYVSLQAVEVGSTDCNEMSQVMNGYLQLKGLLVPSSIEVCEDETSVTGTRLEICIRQRSYDFTPDASDEIDDAFMSGRYYCVPCILCIGLVLRSSGQKGQFKRIGVFEYNHQRETIYRYGIEEEITSRGEDAEKALIAEDLFEEYNEEEDRYTFTII